MTDKHAYLVMAHKSVGNIIDLIKSIDDERNDVFIHLDKKMKICDSDYDMLRSAAIKSHVNFTKRLSVQWGGGSQIKCELLLMQTAIQNSYYKYYHLMSGQDMAIKSPHDIHEFFDNANNKNFLSFSGKDWIARAQDRIRYYYVDAGRRRFWRGINKLSLKIQKILHIDRLKKVDMEIVGGANWASMTDEFVRYLLDNKKKILKIFGRGYCADELYKHTLAYNSEFKDTIYLLDIADVDGQQSVEHPKAYMRYIDWDRGQPYVFTADDFKDIVASGMIFARKFDCEKDRTIQSMILAHIKNDN